MMIKILMIAAAIYFLHGWILITCVCIGILLLPMKDGY